MITIAIALLIWCGIRGSEIIYGNTDNSNSLELIDVRADDREEKDYTITKIKTQSSVTDNSDTINDNTNKNNDDSDNYVVDRNEDIGVIEEKNNNDIGKLDGDANEDIGKLDLDRNEDIAKVSITANIITDGSIDNAVFSNGLVDISYPDDNYFGVAINVGSERDILERLVMGEAGGEGFLGQALVAQCIRDTMIHKDINSVKELIVRMKYSGSLNKPPSDEVKKAVSFIFDGGGYAVKHRIIYFYAPKIVESKFHESQKLVYEYKGHRFFDERK